MDKMADVNKQLTAAEADRRAAEAKWKVLQQQGANGLVQASLNQTLGTLQSSLNAFNQAFTEASQQYDERHPKYIKARAQRDQAQVDLDREIKRAASQIEADYRLTVERE